MAGDVDLGVWSRMAVNESSVDADFVKETTNCKMDLLQYLERTMHGKVKPSKPVLRVQ